MLVLFLQAVQQQRGRRHRSLSMQPLQAADALKQQSVLLGGEADAAAFMSDVGPFDYEAFRAQEAHEGAGRRPQVCQRGSLLGWKHAAAMSYSWNKQGVMAFTLSGQFLFNIREPCTPPVCLSSGRNEPQLDQAPMIHSTPAAVLATHVTPALPHQL